MRAIASTPELTLYGPPLSEGVPRSVRLVLMRHGESQDNVFPCAWLLAMHGVSDPLLTLAGIAQANAARRALADAGIRADVALSSTLMRSQQTALLAISPGGAGARAGGGADGPGGGCGGPVYVAPHVAETHWGIEGGCNGRGAYRCHAFHPASCNCEWPDAQRAILSSGRPGGGVWSRCEPGVGLQLVVSGVKPP